MRIRNSKCVLSVLIAAMMLCGLYGCAGKEEASQSSGGSETSNVQIIETQASDAQSAVQADSQGTQSGEDLDAEEPAAAADDWYKKGNVYTDDNGRSLEVFFDDEGMLGFAVDGLSLYFTTVDNFQQENNWMIYTCDDGTTIIYYPGEPAHIEISDGDYAGLYEENAITTN